MSNELLERTLQSMDRSEFNEHEVWARACDGDGRAFASLFDAHIDRVFRHVVRLVLTPADADEVASAAFFELWRRRAGVTVVGGSVLPWLLVTATNLSRNSSRGSHRYAALIERLPHSPGLAGDPAEEAVAIERRQALRAGLRALSRTDAALIALTSLEGYSTTEAADVLGVSIVAARARLSRARARLRTVLQQQNVEASDTEEVQS